MQVLVFVQVLVLVRVQVLLDVQVQVLVRVDVEVFRGRTFSGRAMVFTSRLG